MDDFSVAVPYGPEVSDPDAFYNHRNQELQSTTASSLLFKASSQHPRNSSLNTENLESHLESQVPSAAMSYCPFLALPQELRDLIFEYAILSTKPNEIHEDNDLCQQHSGRRFKEVHVGTENRWAWIAKYADSAPTSKAAYWNLMLCNRQLRDEMTEFIQRATKDCHKENEAKLILQIACPDIITTWTAFPLPPCQTKTLDITVKVDHMYHPALMTRGSQNAILSSIFDVMKRYIHRGPHLARPSTLCESLRLETLRITLAPPVPYEELTHVYGFPAQQLETLYNQFHSIILRLARSGIPFGSIDAFEVRLEGKEWDRILVTSNIWDEEDFLFMQYGGYIWDARDAPSFEVDLMPW